MRPPTVDQLRWWGSECTECGNATPGSMRCDECQSKAHTVPMWAEAVSMRVKVKR